MKTSFLMKELEDFHKVKGKYKLSNLYRKKDDTWWGTLNDGEYHVCFHLQLNNQFIALISEREYDYYKEESLNILFYLFFDKGKRKIDLPLMKDILDSLEWEYKEEQLWV